MVYIPDCRICESCNLFKYQNNRYKMQQLKDLHLQIERQNLRDYTEKKDESLNSQTPRRDEHKTWRFARPGAHRSSSSSAFFWKHDRRQSLEEKWNTGFKILICSNFHINFHCFKRNSDHEHQLRYQSLIDTRRSMRQLTSEGTNIVSCFIASCLKENQWRFVATKIIN